MILTGFFCAVACALGPGQVAIVDGGVTINGAVVGRYVDDEAPMRAAEVSQAHGLRLAGVKPWEPVPLLPGAIRLREFYPLPGYDYPGGSGDGYILPASFHWPAMRPYTMRERRRAWCVVKRRNPLMVVWYGWTPQLGPPLQRIMRQSCRGIGL